MSTLTREKPVSPAAIQRAKFANAFDTLCDHYQFDLKEYQREKFEIGCEFGEHIHPLVTKNKRFWEYWAFLWNMESVWIAQNLRDVGHADFYDMLRTAKQNEQFIHNAINYINRTDDTQAQ
jgi:hypothetical protein